MDCGQPSADKTVDLADPPRLHVVASPAEMEPIAAQTSIAVVPLRIGGGTRLKILEALAWGLPVVTTSVGCEPWQSLTGATCLFVIPHKTLPAE